MSHLRRDALEAMHTYLCEACDYDLTRSMRLFNHLVRTIDNHLAPRRERSTDPR